MGERGVMETVSVARLGVRPGDLSLDLGAGDGRHLPPALAAGAAVVAVDLSRDGLAAAARRVADLVGAGTLAGPVRLATVVADATRLPFADGAFDAVIASEVLEHVSDDEAAAGEIARVARPGARVAVSVPRWFPERICWALSESYHTVEGGHVRIYRRGRLRRLLTRAGVDVEAVSHAHGLHSPYWWVRCAVGPHRDDHPAVAAFRRLLEWEILSDPPLLRAVERILAPVMGKSVILYSVRDPWGG